MAGAPPRLTSFLVKVASRCNLACDYCYIYEHADQSWADQPAVMAEATVNKLADRLAEYSRSEGIDRLLVIFHGGEPLIAGAGRLVTAGPSTSWAGRTTGQRSTAPWPAGYGTWTSPTAWVGCESNLPWRRPLPMPSVLPSPVPDWLPRRRPQVGLGHPI